MRVLWFSASSSNYQSENDKGSVGYNGAGWINSIQNALSAQEEIALGICFCMNGQPQEVTQGGTVYYPIPHHTKSKKNKILDLWHYDDVLRDKILWPYYIEHFKHVIRVFQPDVIEVFGSELYIGLGAIAAKELNVPCVIHIQGLLSLLIHAYFPIGVSKLKYYLSDGVRGAYDKFQLLTYWNRSCYREKEILRSCRHVLGRTEWDRNAISILNPNAQYHYGGEVLRSCFYGDFVRHIPSKLTIITISSGASYKGYDLVLKIANILKNECQLDFEWKVYGNVSPDFFEKLTGIRHEDVNVHLCGVATAEQLRDAMLVSTVYVQPSYIENSPNSVAEAQMIGLPIVASNVGGTSSMVEEGVSGYLYPVTDPYMAAYYIKKCFEDLELNIQMGKAGKCVAEKRHNETQIVEDLIKVYKSIADVN